MWRGVGQRVTFYPLEFSNDLSFYYAYLNRFSSQLPSAGLVPRSYGPVPCSYDPVDAQRFKLYHWPINSDISLPSKHKTFVWYCTMLDQRWRRWADVVQRLYKYFVFAEHPRFSWYKISPYFDVNLYITKTNANCDKLDKLLLKSTVGLIGLF